MPQLLMEALTHLEVVCSPLDDQAISRFALCKQLRSLDIRSTPLLTCVGLQSFQRDMRHLHTIRFSGCVQVTSDGIVHLLNSGCEDTLRVLDLSGTSCDDEVFPPLALCTRLHELRVVSCKYMRLGNWNACGLDKHPSLAVITLTDVGEVNASLRFPPQTEALYMRGAICSTRETFLHAVQDLPALQNLTIGLQIPCCVRNVRVCQWVRRITLSLWEPSGIPPLGHLPLLAFFMLDEAPNVESATLEEALAGARAIIKLVVSGCPALIDPIDLQGLPTLRFVQVATDCTVRFVCHDQIKLESAPPVSRARIFMG